jgi:hypothetical protein
MDESKTVMLVLLQNNTYLVTEITEVVADIGQPDCKFINPMVINFDGELVPWMDEWSNTNEIMISSDKILTIVDPKPELIQKYLELIQ